MRVPLVCGLWGALRATQRRHVVAEAMVEMARGVHRGRNKAACVGLPRGKPASDMAAWEGQQP